MIFLHSKTNSLNYHTFERVLHDASIKYKRYFPQALFFSLSNLAEALKDAYKNSLNDSAVKNE